MYPDTQRGRRGCFLVIACWLAEKYNQDVHLSIPVQNDVSRKQYLDDIVEARVDRSFGRTRLEEVAKNLPITLLRLGPTAGYTDTTCLSKSTSKQIKAVEGWE